MIDNFFTLILMCIFVEAVTKLIFYAAPLQGIKNYIRARTPMLYSTEREEHLLDCKYCTSVWVAAFFVSMYLLFWPNIILTFVFYVCIIHRVSNYLHVIVGIMNDKQIDMRIARGKR